MTQDSAEPVLVARARAGSADAFGRLVHIHQQGLRAFLRRLTANHADADDIAQETFVFAWEHIARFDPGPDFGRPFRPWLFGIAWRKYREGKRGWIRRLTRQGRAAQGVPTAHTAGRRIAAGDYKVVALKHGLPKLGQELGRVLEIGVDDAQNLGFAMTPAVINGAG